MSNDLRDEEKLLGVLCCCSRKEGAMCTGAGAGFVRVVQARVCVVMVHVGAGVGLGLGEGVVASAGAGVKEGNMVALIR